MFWSYSWDWRACLCILSVSETNYLYLCDRPLPHNSCQQLPSLKIDQGQTQMLLKWEVQSARGVRWLCMCIWDSKGWLNHIRGVCGYGFYGIGRFQTSYQQWALINDGQKETNSQFETCFCCLLLDIEFMINRGKETLKTPCRHALHPHTTPLLCVSSRARSVLHAYRGESVSERDDPAAAGRAQLPLLLNTCQSF